MATFDLAEFEEREDFVCHMKVLLDYIARLKQYSLTKDVDEYQALYGKQEALKEKAERILLNYSEEWRLVIKLVPTIVAQSLETLERLNPMEPPFDMTMDLLKNVAVCVGVKRIGRYWPTEVTWLTKLIDWSEVYLSQAAADSSRWSSIYLLVLWLSSAVKTPFALAKFDEPTKMPTAQRLSSIIEITTPIAHLFRVIHLLIGNFYARPDIIENSKLLNEFIARLKIKFSEPQAPTNHRVAYLRAFAALLKSVNRVVMQKFVPSLCKMSFEWLEAGHDHELMTKYCIKILGRSAMCLMKPKQFRHRYDLGHRVLSVANTTDSMAIAKQVEPEEEEREQEFDELEMEFFDQVGSALTARISDKSTQVRYSISKYLAAICARLPPEISLGLLDFICEQCTDMSTDAAWHGSCLTLAQFVARRLVPVDRLPSVVQLTKVALFYDQIKGSFSLGGHVRDAAAYICYSMPRAYRDTEVEPYLTELAPALLCMACFDRELNCRRAASAVIQEWTGRTGGKFPHWQEVIRWTEFNELSSIESAFLVCGVAFSSPEFELYHEPIVSHLVDKLQTHWDVEIRRLVAKALGKICKSLKVDKFKQTWARLVDEQKGFGSLPGRHGTILAWSYIIEADHNILDRCPALVEKISDLISKLKDSQLFLGVGGDFMREATLRLIGFGFRTKRRLPAEAEWQKFLLETIDGYAVENEVVQAETVGATLALLNSSMKETSAKVLDQLAHLVSKGKPLTVSTVCKVVVQFEIEQFEEPCLAILLQSIVDFMSKMINNPNRRSETMADAVQAIIKLACFENGKLCRVEVFDLLVQSLSDHTVNNKGDAGAVVRLAAIQVVMNYVDYLDDGQCLRIFQLVAAEAAFHRVRTFGQSFGTLAELATKLGAELEKAGIDGQVLERMIEVSKIEANLANDMDTQKHYEVVIELIDSHPMTWDLLPGLVCVMVDPLMKRQIKEIIEHLNKTAEANRKRIIEVLLQFYEAYAKDIRLSLRLMMVIKEVLLNVQFDVPGGFERIADISWQACEKMNNPKKYLLAVDILTTLVPLDVATNLKMAWQYLHVLLGHRIPRVRQYTALELFTMFVTIEGCGEYDEQEEKEKSEIFEQLNLKLQGTDWLMADIEVVKKVRNEVRELARKLM